MIDFLQALFEGRPLLEKGHGLMVLESILKEASFGAGSFLEE